MLVPRGGSNTLTGGGRTNTWDGQNRLTQCVFNGTTTTHTYGSDGLRRRTVEGATTTDYVLDGTSVVRTVVNNGVDRTYLHGARGPEYERIGANDPVWYLYDGLGSVLGTVDKNGSVVSTRKYDVYGAVRGSTGPSGTKHKFVGSLGHPSEDDTGLVYMRARWMDPVSGRFVSEDPALDGSNWFAYCDSNPTNSRDPNGLQTVTETSISTGNGGVVSGNGASSAFQALDRARNLIQEVGDLTELIVELTLEFDRVGAPDVLLDAVTKDTQPGGQWKKVYFNFYLQDGRLLRVHTLSKLTRNKITALYGAAKCEWVY